MIASKIKIKKIAKLDQNQYDAPWKQILDKYLRQFLELCLPKLHQEIDWSKPYEALDNELQKIIRPAKNGKRIIDKLFKVFLLSGQEIELYIHIEVQNQVDVEFPERMYTCQVRIYDHRKKPVFSLAILGDDAPNWRPNQYQRKIPGFRTSIDFKFDIIKLIDFKEKQAELMASKNPFALIIVAHLATLEKYIDLETKLNAKTGLARLLIHSGFSKQEIWDIFCFLDWAMALPEALEKVYNNNVKQIQEDFTMQYVTSFERFALREGIAIGEAKGIAIGEAKGIAIGEKELLERLLQRKFKMKTLPKKYVTCLDTASAEQLLEWGDRILDAGHIDDVFGE